MITDADTAMMLDKMYTDAADEFVKMVEPVVKQVDMSKMTNDDFLKHCRNAFEAGVAKGVNILFSIDKSLGVY